MSDLERFLELLRALSSQLREHNRAISRLNIAQVQQRLENEHEICGELVCLFPQIENALRNNGCQPALETGEALRSLGGKIHVAARELSGTLRTHLAVAVRNA
jgi:hypothetical protein